MKTESCTICTDKAIKHADSMEKNIEKYERYFEQFQDTLSEGDAEVLLTNHENKREVFRAFSRSKILEAIQNGWLIEAFAKGNQSYDVIIIYHLQVGHKMYRPVHVCGILDAKNNKLIVKTVYDPRSHAWKWSDNYEKRVCFCKKEESFHD
jgi:hypothetical protein